MKPSLPLLVAAALGLTGCSIADQAPDNAQEATPSVTIMTHDSFNVPEELVTPFDEESRYSVTTPSPGDAVAVLNQVTLQKDTPTADAVYGIDKYSAPTLLSEDILVPHGAELGDAQQYAVDSDTDGDLAPIDQGQVCVHMDNDWLVDSDLAPPGSVGDLTEH